jgi:hypothetical protein
MPLGCPDWFILHISSIIIEIPGYIMQTCSIPPPLKSQWLHLHAHLLLARAPAWAQNPNSQPTKIFPPKLSSVLLE